MPTVFYHSTVACPIPERDIRKAVRLAAEREKKIKGQIDITVVGDTTIRRLNKQYRGKDAVTDVLSFAWEEDKKMPSAYLGQIYLSYPQIKRQARRFQVSATEEFIRMLVHGLLHIVGYDHVKPTEAKRMFARQEAIVKEVNRGASFNMPL